MYRVDICQKSSPVLLYTDKKYSKGQTGPDWSSSWLVVLGSLFIGSVHYQGLSLQSLIHTLSAMVIETVQP